jgi:ABC-type sulfate/molybdate transport systems ATPase subunit
VLLVSEDLDEILELADRVAVISGSTVDYVAPVGETDRAASIWQVTEIERSRGRATSPLKRKNRIAGYAPRSTDHNLCSRLPELASFDGDCWLTQASKRFASISR